MHHNSPQALRLVLSVAVLAILSAVTISSAEALPAAQYWLRFPL